MLRWRITWSDFETIDNGVDDDGNRVLMMNPYRPTSAESSLPPPVNRLSRYTVAGGWLGGAGLLHFIAINLLSDTRSISSLHLSPLILILIGWAVMYRYRIAIVLARLIGSLAIMFLVLTVILLLAGFDDLGGISYGTATVTDPAPWQIGLILSVVAVTLLPPWWSLQRAMAENDEVHRDSV